MQYIGRRYLRRKWIYIDAATAFIPFLLFLDTFAYKASIVNTTENHLRCQKLCVYQSACAKFQFKNKRCLLITDHSSPDGEPATKSTTSGNITSPVCGENDVCIPTGRFAPGYRGATLPTFDVIGLKKIKIYTTGLTFGGAKQFCENEGGQLFVIQTQDQWYALVDFIQSEIQSTGKSRYGYWINGNHVNGRYITTSGKPMPFTVWITGEPSGQYGGESEDCVVLQRDREFRMNDSWCRLNNGFICEWNIFS